ncbi:hypothetical protein Tco_1090954 [Tanacetum coccineum]|uniref:Reverse transcriptase domain-containing protein n=1 Tax=Tanacetum coccineum TaxID=301880 RepID=A0ABQ5I5V5_9ASTR
MFPKEVDKIEKYIGGLPDMILGSVKASKSAERKESMMNLLQTNKSAQQKRESELGRPMLQAMGDRKHT